MRSCPNCGSKNFKLSLTEGVFKIVKCKDCSLIYLQNIPDEKNIYEDYYEIDYSKDDYHKNSKLGYIADIFLINEQRIKYLKRLKQSGKLLDIGCGAGLFMKSASDSGYDVHGIDVSDKALSFAKKEFEFDVSKKTLDELISGKKTFDIITLWHVTEHFINPVNELRKIRNLLAKDGVCLIEVPNFNSLKFRISKKKFSGGNHPLYHRTFFTSRTLKETLSKSGFRNMKRLKISYELPGKSYIYNKSKDLFNLAAMDAFLDFAVWK